MFKLSQINLKLKDNLKLRKIFFLFNDDEPSIILGFGRTVNIYKDETGHVKTIGVEFETTVISFTIKINDTDRGVGKISKSKLDISSSHFQTIP